MLLVVAPRVRALGIPGPAPGAPMAPSCSAAPRACALADFHQRSLLVLCWLARGSFALRSPLDAPQDNLTGAHELRGLRWLSSSTPRVKLSCGASFA